MKKSLLSLALIAFMGMGAANAANPDLWIRGGNFGWEGSDCKEVNHFTENNGIYTLTVASLTGNFKIATKTASGGWDDTYNYGGNGSPLNVELDKEYTLGNGQGSKNMTPVGNWSNVTLTFDINTQKLKVTGTATEDVITYAVHGEFLSSTWADVTLKDDDNDGKWVSDAFTPTVLSGKFGARQLTNGSQTKWYAGSSAQTLTAGGSVKFIENGSVNASYTCEAGKQYILTFDVPNLTVSMVEAGGQVTYPEQMYVIGNVNDADWSPTNGVLLTKSEEGVYTGEALIGNAMLSGFGYFSFCTKMGSSATDWSGIEPRYGATAADFAPEFTDKTATCDITGGDNSFKVTADKTYAFILDLKNMKVTITEKASAPQPTTATYDFTAPATLNPAQPAEYKNADGEAVAPWQKDYNNYQLFLTDKHTKTLSDTNKPLVLTSNGASLTYTTTTGSAQPWRIYVSSDVMELRLTKSTEMTLTAPDKYKITKITIENTTDSKNHYVSGIKVNGKALTKDADEEGFSGVKYSYAPAEDAIVKEMKIVASSSGTNKISKIYVETAVASGIENVYDVEDADAPVYYYNLQGVRVENPNNGIFIRVQGKKATKVMF